MSVRRKRPSVPTLDPTEEVVVADIAGKQEASEATKAAIAAEAEAEAEAEAAEPMEAAKAASPPSIPEVPVPEVAAPPAVPEATTDAPAKKPMRERTAPLAIMDENFAFIDAVYRSRHTLLDILAARGYDVERYRKFSPAEAAHAAVISNMTGLSFQTTKLKDPTAACQVYYGAIGHQMLDRFLAEHVTDEDSERTEVIIMQPAPITDRHHVSALQQFMRPKEEGGRRKLRVSFFCIDNLVINPLNHVLVPKHEIVPEEQHKELLASLYVTSKAKLPEIKFHADPIARCIGAMPGDIIKITRASISAGEAVIYRVCAP
jgi:DNA-directed RNA polymerase subunit H